LPPAASGRSRSRDRRRRPRRPRPRLMLPQKPWPGKHPRDQGRPVWPTGRPTYPGPALGAGPVLWAGLAAGDRDVACPCGSRGAGPAGRSAAEAQGDTRRGPGPVLPGPARIGPIRATANANHGKGRQMGKAGDDRPPESRGEAHGRCQLGRFPGSLAPPADRPKKPPRGKIRRPLGGGRKLAGGRPISPRLAATG
jgi:hypothetical protein